MSELRGLCIAHDCMREIYLAHPMCARHWEMIPHSLRDEIRDTCIAWVHDSNRRKPYDLAVARAKLIIAEKEDQPGEVLQMLNAEVARLGDLQ